MRGQFDGRAILGSLGVTALDGPEGRPPRRADAIDSGNYRDSAESFRCSCCLVSGSRHAASSVEYVPTGSILWIKGVCNERILRVRRLTR